MRTAIGYIRKSNKADNTAASLEQQEFAIREYCARKNLDLVAIRSEVQSAYKAKRRPVWDQCLADLASGEVGHVVVWNLDRASRTGILGLAEVLEAIKEMGGVLHSATQELDLSTTMGQGIAGILASLAKQESENISERVKRGKKAAAEKGGRSGGPRPFGFTETGEPIEEEAAWIRQMVEWRQEGWSPNRIAAALEEAGVPTVRGGKWSAASVTTILRSPRICGVRTHRGKWYPEAWEPIISVKEWESIQWERGSPNTRKHPQGLLTAKKLIYCGLCDGPLYDNLTRYVCRNGGEVVISQQKADAAVMAEVESILARIGGKAPKPQTDVEELRKRLDSWTEMFTSGEMDRAEWLKGRADLQERLRVEEARLELSERVEDAQHGNKLRLVKKVIVGKPGPERLKVECDYPWMWEHSARRGWDNMMENLE